MVAHVKENDYRPELIFALVGPAGIRINDLSTALKRHLKSFGYETIDIRLSDLLSNTVKWSEPDGLDEYSVITHKQHMGNQFRNELQDGAALARAGIASIREKRNEVSKNPDVQAFAHAFIIQQLKHPEEVELLREVYGSSFFLIAGHAPRNERVDSLSKQMAHKDDQPGKHVKYTEKAAHIIEVDDKEDDGLGLGQNTRDAYPLADYFANLGKPSGEHTITRFIDLLFGHPFHTPFPEEYAMYQAASASLRSSDDSRQVGAVIVDLKVESSKITNIDIVALGLNEVPRRGGGFYWHEDSPDGRDQWLVAYRDDDRAKKIKRSVLIELIDVIKKKEWLSDDVRDRQTAELAKDLLLDLKGTQFSDIGEFGRPVHAEMAALIDSARRGVSVDGLSMYVTTFPCHNCAKHIIAAGIKNVIYLEPYPKSRAELLHQEEINVDWVEGKARDDRVIFSAYSGVAPRQYQQLFSMSLRGNKKGIPLKQWPDRKHSLHPKHVARNAFEASVVAERQELEKLSEDVYRWDKNKICPAS